MAGIVGSNLVGGGLVFQYDMANTKKSFKGKPTVNLNNQTISGITITVSFVETTSDGWDKYSFNGTWNNGTYPFMIAISATTLTGSVSYSTAWEIKCNVREKFADGVNFGRILYVNESNPPSGGTSIRTDLGVDRDGLEITRWERNGFQYSSVFANPTTNQPGYINSRPVADGTVFTPATDFIWIRKVQVEEGLFATPYINGTRSATEALLDISGSNLTTTTNSLTYNSDNTFTFSATDWASVTDNGTLNLINNVTLEAWVRYTTAINRVLIEKSSNNTHYQFQIFSSTQGTSGAAGEIVFMLQANASNWVVAGESSNDGQWHHLVGTYDRSATTAILYIDGVLKNTNSGITTGPTSNTGILAIGSRSGTVGFGGDIGETKVYNRALTAVEVLQNFEATRNRYGI